VYDVKAAISVGYLSTVPSGCLWLIT